jgi:hypothetical protein
MYKQPHFKEASILLIYYGFVYIKWGNFKMYFVIYNKQEEVICEDINDLATNLVNGWKLYGFSESEKLALSLLHECKYY